MNKENTTIITYEDHNSACLHTTSPPLTSENWNLVYETAEKLLYVRNHILKGGAGLAAPQIGINLPIFIYTSDRTAETLRIVINPSYEPIGESKLDSFEACYSVPLKCTKIKRWEKIRVTYQNLREGHVSEDLDGFAAKVFQHEMDHLKGTLTVDHETAEVISFSDQASYLDFMKSVVEADQKRYSHT